MDKWPLTNSERQQYLAWALRNNVPESNDYDMEGFYKASQNPLSGLSASVNPNDNQMHYPDTFKLPNHPTFSTHSKYYDPKTMPNTPTWQGGPIGTQQGMAQGAESWTLRKPNGAVVASEAPWLKGK
jgi:predicted RNA-binding protein with PUA-like domain